MLNIRLRESGIKKFEIIWIFFLGVLTIILSSQIIDYYNASSFLYDDTLYLNVVNSLLSGEGFTINLVFPIPEEYYNQFWKISEYIDYYNVTYLVQYDISSYDKLANFYLGYPVYECSTNCGIYKPYSDNNKFTNFENILKRFNYDIAEIKFMLYSIISIEELETMQSEKTFDISRWSNFKDNIFSSYEKYRQSQDQKLQQAKFLEQLHENYGALQIYDKILAIEEYNIDALEGEIRIYKLEGDNSKVNSLYEKIYQFYEGKIKRNNPYDLPKETYEKKYEYAVKTEIKLWETKSNNKLLGSYEELIKFDRWDREGWYGKATTLKKLERYPESINAYNMFLKLSPFHEEEKEIHEKIEFLKNRIFN